MRARSYVLWVMGLTAITLTAIGAGVTWIDPYGQRVTTISGWNQMKPALVDSTRLFAAQLIDREAPATIVVGNSRLLVALDPHDPALAWTPAPRVNACLGSASMYEVQRMVQHAAAQGSLRLVILAADWDLYGTETGTMPGWSETRLAVSQDGRAQLFHRWEDTAACTWSWTAVQDAWTCWDASRTGEIDRIDLSSGFAGREGYWQKHMAEHGHRGVANWMESTWGKGMAGWQDDASYHSREMRLQKEFAQTLSVAWAAGAEVRVVLAPVHARWLSLLDRLGMLPAWQRHRHNLVETIATTAAAHQHAVPELIDFAGWEGHNAEPFPAAGDRTPMHWWWESSHAQASYGRLIAQQLGGENGPGVVLNATTIEAHLDHQATARTAWRAAHPDDLAEIAGEW